MSKFIVAEDITISFGEGADEGHANYTKGAEINFYVSEQENLVVETLDHEGKELGIEISDAAIAEEFLNAVLSVDEELTETTVEEVPFSSLIAEGFSVDDLAKSLVSELRVTMVRDGEKVIKNVPLRRIKKRLSTGQKAALAKARRKAHSGHAMMARAKSMKMRKRLGLESVDFKHEGVFIESLTVPETPAETTQD
jgi:hypothetical protein